MTLGGFGSLGGAVAGGLLLGVTEQWVGSCVSTKLIDITAYLFDHPGAGVAAQWPVRARGHSGRSVNGHAERGGWARWTGGARVLRSSVARAGDPVILPILHAVRRQSPCWSSIAGGGRLQSGAQQIWASLRFMKNAAACSALARTASGICSRVPPRRGGRSGPGDPARGNRGCHGCRISGEQLTAFRGIRNYYLAIVTLAFRRVRWTYASW